MNDGQLQKLRIKSMTSKRNRYRRKAGRPVVAVQLKLDTAGFEYKKWGSDQRCKANDWLVDNAGEVYTIDSVSFERTYKPLDLGTYVKTGKIWAEQATESGFVNTKEGKSQYSAGDWLVSNEEDGSDAYTIGPKKFDDMYELDEDQDYVNQ